MLIENFLTECLEVLLLLFSQPLLVLLSKPSPHHGVRTVVCEGDDFLRNVVLVDFLLLDAWLVDLVWWLTHLVLNWINL